MRRARLAAGLLAGLGAALAGACAVAPAAAPWQPLFDGHSLQGWQVTEFGGEGAVAVQDGALQLGLGSPLTGVTWTGAPPHGDYELLAEASRELGNDFFLGLTFPVGQDHLTLVLGGWGGSVCGFSSLDGQDAARNATRALRHFTTGRRYTVRIEVTAARVAAYLDGTLLAEADPRRHQLSLRPEMLPNRPLGVASFATAAALHRLAWRPRR